MNELNEEQLKQMGEYYKIVEKWGLPEEMIFSAAFVIYEGETDYDRLKNYFIDGLKPKNKETLEDLSMIIGRKRALEELGYMLKNEYLRVYKSSFRDKNIDDLLNDEN
jgi:hypothetical protein